MMAAHGLCVPKIRFRLQNGLVASGELNFGIPHVGADEEHVLGAAVAELGHDARPEAGPLALLDPEAETVTLALERDADRDVDRLLAHDLLVTDRDLHRVQVDGDVELLERPALPGADVVLDR